MSSASRSDVRLATKQVMANVSWSEFLCLAKVHFEDMGCAGFCKGNEKNSLVYLVHGEAVDSRASTLSAGCQKAERV